MEDITIRNLSQSLQYELMPLGDSCVLIRLGNQINEETHIIVTAVAKLLEQSRLHGIIDIVPAFASVAVHYDPLLLWKSRNAEETRHETIFETMSERLHRQLQKLSHVKYDPVTHRTIRIPVCYGGKYGPDLREVAAYCNMTEDEVITIHSSKSYMVYMIGFAPGFPYLGGMSSDIAAPRRQTPRTVIPAGSVGIAGEQTGVYPIATPGGWQLIGRTPIALFRPRHEQPSLLAAGDRIEFEPITEEQYDHWLSYDEDEASIVWEDDA